MRRRTFLASTIPAVLATAVVAQEAKTKHDRLSGTVKMVDKDKKIIHMAPRNAPSAQRQIMWTDNTKWTLDGKPADASAAADGMSVVAIGKFEGVSLQATDISLKHK